MSYIRTSIIVLVSALICCGCGKEGPSQQFPEREAKDAIAMDLPAFAELSSLDFVAVQQTGDEITPSFRARFEGELTLRDDTFEINSRDTDVTFLQPASEKGDKRKAYGVISLEYKAGTWVGRPKFDRPPLEGAGQPRDLLSQGRRTIVRGTSEETDYVEELEAQERARVKEQEERRKAAEKAREEQERAAAEARQERASKISECTLGQLAGVYGSRWGDLDCAEQEQSLVCCYRSETCENRIELTRSSDKQSLTGKWSERGGTGPATFPITENCELSDGRWGNTEGAEATNSWSIRGKK